MYFQIIFDNYRIDNKLAHMILLIFSILIIIALVAIFFLKIPQKIMILSICVIILVILNFVNEIQAFYDDDIPTPPLSSKNKQMAYKLNRTTLTKLDNNTSNMLNSELLDEQRQMVNYLLKKIGNKQYSLIYFTELHKNRLRSILQLLQYRHTAINPDKLIQIYHLNYDEYQCNYNCLSNNFPTPSSATYFLIIQNIHKPQDLNNIYHFYETHNITMIFQNIPKYFNMHTISRLTQIYKFSNNYLPKILQQHLPKVIQTCSLYHTFDYHFYIASLKTSLSQLCTKVLPSNAVTKCLNKLIKEQKQKIPEGWGRKCLDLSSNNYYQGVIFQNGWLWLKKQYFWSDKINKDDYSNQSNL